MKSITNVKGPAPARSCVAGNRSARLKKIRASQREIESALLTLREHFKVNWTDKCFEDLYYLVRLARKAS